MMIGAFVGAFVVLAISILLSWQFTGGIPGGRNPRGQAAEADRVVMRAAPGECLRWTKPDSSDITKVGCEQEHLFQIAGDVDLAKDHPPDAPYPTEQQWLEIRQQRCVELVDKLIGGRFDPFGRYTIGAFNPSEQGWKDNDRTMRCGLQLAGPSGALYPMTGPVTAAGQSDIEPIGTCLGIEGKIFTDPVDCALPHAYEIVGVLDLETMFKRQDGYPDEKKQDTALEAACSKAAADYAGGPSVVADKKLTVVWDTRQQPSWEAGSMKVNCKVGALLPDRSGLAPVTGGVKGPVTVGTEPAPVGQRPLRPGVPAPPAG